MPRPLRVAIVGAGAIGILTAASAQQMGAAEVAVEARHPHQHQARECIGAVVYYPIAPTLSLTDGADALLDCIKHLFP